MYWLFLPTLSSDPRPSMTVFTLLLLEILISSQLLLVQTSFSQQEKDQAIVQREVMNEYDTKFVHPNLHPLVRDVGTQYTEMDREEDVGGVDTYSPTIILKRGFRTKPNPNYAKHLDPDNTGAIQTRTYSPTISSYTPSAYNNNRQSTPSTGVTPTPRPVLRQPQFRQSTSTAVSSSTSTGDGGSLGVYSHASSPLKKATSMYDLPGGTPRNSFDMAKKEIHEQRERNKSPVRTSSTATPPFPATSRMSLLDGEGERRAGATTALGRSPATQHNTSRGSLNRRFA